MSSFNHYAPSFRIVVKGTELRHGVTVDVLSVSVTESFNKADTFTFTVRDRHPEKERMFAGGDKLKWMDSDTFKEGNEVKIHLGYRDNLNLILLGEITAVSPNFPASGQPTLNVQGNSLYHMLRRQQLRKPFKSTTDSAIAKEIASSMKLTADVDETNAEHPLVSPNGQDCAKFLEHRAKRIGYEVAVKGNTLLFKQPGYIDNPSPLLTLEWGKSLISFSPRLSTYKKATEITVRGTQTSQGRGKDPVVGTAQAGDERVKMGKETGLQISLRVFGEEKVIVEEHNIADEQEANEMALAQLEARALEFITGKGACIGEPKLRARNVIALKGLGKRYSGNYYVTSTTHAIGASGYRTDFNIKRNAI